MLVIVAPMISTWQPRISWGVIDDARSHRRRRRQTTGAALVAIVLAACAYAAFGEGSHPAPSPGAATGSLRLHNTTPPAHLNQVPLAVRAVLNDCIRHNHLTRAYPLTLLQQALSDMPRLVREYTICAQEIDSAQQAQLTTK
jgi:hypothetical protein